MQSTTYYGQRKRKQASEKAKKRPYDVSKRPKGPLRLYGGVGSGGSVSTASQSAGYDIDRRAHQDAQRALAHEQWIAEGNDLDARHYYWNQTMGMNNPAGGPGKQRVGSWHRVMADTQYEWDPTGNNWFFNEGDHPEYEIEAEGEQRDESANNLEAEPGHVAITPFRAYEITTLRQQANHLMHVGMLPMNMQFEARWGFQGMSDSSMGPAWSAFWYGLSDLYLGGYTLASNICFAIMMICEDITFITNTTGHNLGDSLCFPFFEGMTNPTSPDRHFLECRGYNFTLNSIMNDPTEVLEAMVQAFQSENNRDFLFHRVYVHVLTRVGGSLKDMPYWMTQLREGPYYKEVKGYQLIPDAEDNSCGFDAVLWALSNTATRIQKMCKKVEKAVPEICLRFANYRRRVYSLKGGKREKKLYEVLKAELASYINWQSGTPLTHEQLCEMVSTFSTKYDLDLGLAIFDAIHPLSTYSINYDPKKKVPSEILCLVSWQYRVGDEENGMSRTHGHYDCINTTNVTKWLTTKHAAAYNKNMRFSFHSMALIPTSQADDKGVWCNFCKHWQRGGCTKMEWESLHGMASSVNIDTVICYQCGVTFKSLECFTFHNKKNHGLAITACDSQSRCVACTRIHSRSFNCEEFYCKVCYTRFPKQERATHVCYLRHSSEKKSKRVEMVIYADMEGSRINGVHEAVCISCCWTTICEEHKVFRNKSTKNKKRCHNCYYHTENWEWFCEDCIEEYSMDECSNECPDCLQKHFKYFSGSDCLVRFLDWVMTQHLGATVVFHNGGKYDLHILVPVVLSSKKYYVANDANRSTQIIFLTLGVMDGKEVEGKAPAKKSKERYVYFKDSLNFIQSSLKSFEKMFHLKAGGKGRFPYELLNEKGWDNWDGKCPGPEYFGITPRELIALDMLATQRKEEIKDILDYIKEENERVEFGQNWVAMDKLKLYTMKDTEVLHDGCEEFRRQFWLAVGHDPFQYVTLPAAVAGAYRAPQYMPANSIQIFNVMDREWQHKGLRGGRCEMFKAYWRKTKPTQHFRWVDINSEYPFVQAFGYYPFGPMTLELNYEDFKPYREVSIEFYKKTGMFLEDVLQDSSGKTGCGLIECEFVTAKDVFLPVLPCRIQTESQVNKEEKKKKKKTGYMKNVFQITQSTSIFFLTVLAAAVAAKQVQVVRIKRIQFWRTTSNLLFRKFMCALYAGKVEASGWEKIFNTKDPEQLTEERKIEFVKECKRRDILIDIDKVEDNPGRRNTLKIANNSGWGFLSKKLTTNETYFFDNYDAEAVEDMVSLIKDLESEEGKRMVGVPVSVGHYTKVRSNKKAELVTLDEMDKRVAYHVGGQVPAYGLQMISAGLLSLDPSQIVYCDTDSIAYVYDEENPLHKEIPTGPYLGDFVDEYPTEDITEFVSTGCKSYYVKMNDLKKKDKITFKGRFKGIPFNSAAFSLTDEKKDFAKLGMEEMKSLLFNSIERIYQSVKGEPTVDQLTYEFHYTNFFKRNQDYKIKATPEHKTVRFTYDKRKIILPEDMEEGWRERVTEINTLPLDDGKSNITRADVTRWLESEIADRLGADPDVGMYAD